MNTATPHDVDWRAEYDALVQHAGLVDLGHRTQIEVGGADRAAWLHNLTTNEIRKLAPGAGCEAFLTSVQGKILAHLMVFAAAESIVLDTVAGQAKANHEHNQQYMITEQVTLIDRSETWSELLLGGPQAEALLADVAGTKPPAERLAHGPATVAGHTVWLRRADVTGPTDFLISGQSAEVAAAKSALIQSGALECGDAAFEAARVEWGFPLYGPDISEKNLPQEVARDAQTISFVKGCYLGQETVARIDALGHVNKTLVGVRFANAAVPEPGLELTAGGKGAGTVTSVAYSPRLEAPMALAYVRRGSTASGTPLDSALGAAKVVTLPVR
jgi:folate-binding protein YgfZ